MSLFKAYKVFKTASIFLFLGASIANPFAAYSASNFSRLLAQVPSTLDCRAERQQAEAALLNAVVDHADQLLTHGQIELATQLLGRTLKQVRRMENPQARVALLQRLVGGEAYSESTLDRLLRISSKQRSEIVLTVLPAALEAAQTLGSGYSVAKTQALVAIANAYIRLERSPQSAPILAQAQRASQTIQGAEPKAIALNEIAWAYINAKQPEQAAQTLERSLLLAQAIRHSDPYRKANILNRIAALYAQINQLERALTVLQSIQAPSYQSETILAIVNQYSKQQQFDRALTLSKTLPPNFKAIALATLAGQLTASQPQRAAQTYAEAVATAKTVQNAESVLAELASQYVKVGGIVTTADETVQAIANPVVQAPALGAIALSYAQAGQLAEAEARLQQAIERLKAIPSEQNPNGVRQQLLDLLMQRGRYDYALQVAQAIQPKEESPFERVDVLTQIAEQAIAVKRYDAALQVVEQIPPQFAYWRDRLLLQLARGFVQTGKYEEAVKIAQQDNADPGYQPRMLAIVAAEMQLAGQSEPAKTVFNQAIAQANSITDGMTKTAALGAIAQAYLAANQPELANQLLNQALTTAQAIEDVSNRSYILRTLAEQLTFANYYQAAIQVAEPIPDPSERIAKLNEAVEKAVNSGDLTTAFSVLDHFNNPIPKTRWLLTLAERYRVWGNNNQALNLLGQAFATARTVPGEESRTIVVRGGEASITTEDNQDRGSFLTEIALQYAQLSQAAQARQVAQALESQTLRQLVMKQISCYSSSK